MAVKPDVAKHISYIDNRIRAVEALDNNPNVGKVEIAAYQLIIKALKGNVEENDPMWILMGEPSRVKVIAQREYIKQNGDLVSVFADARERSAERFNQILETFRLNAPEMMAKIEVMPLPIVCLQVDDVDLTSRALGVKPQDLSEALFSEAPFWKRSEHIILGSKTHPAHNFMTYLMILKNDYGGVNSLEKIVEDEDIHEQTHLINDEITSRRFGVNNTWFNEGISEYFAGLLSFGRSKLIHFQLTPNISNVMDANGRDEMQAYLKHCGGCLLIAAIGTAYCPDHPEIGIVNFSERLYGNGQRAEESLNEAALRILGEDGKMEKVTEIFASYFDK